jgi:chromosome segregation ATPase
MPSAKYYDPVKAHEYYERTKKLKGRKKGSNEIKVKTGKPSPKKTSSNKKKAIERVNRLKKKVETIERALTEVYAAMSKKRQEKRKTAKENSDGKTTAKERQSSKEYRDKHKEELKAKRKAKGGSSGSSSSGPKSVDDMSLDELQDRATRLRAALTEAKRQLSNANQQLGQLAHSAIVEAPSINELFARFQSAERTPSK